MTARLVAAGTAYAHCNRSQAGKDQKNTTQYERRLVGRTDFLNRFHFGQGKREGRRWRRPILIVQMPKTKHGQRRVVGREIGHVVCDATGEVNSISAQSTLRIAIPRGRHRRHFCSAGRNEKQHQRCNPATAHRQSSSLLSRQAFTMASAAAFSLRGMCSTWRLSNIRWRRTTR